MFACLYVPDFSVQAALLPERGDAREILRRSPVVILDGPSNLPRVVALNDPARRLGIAIGMTKLQVETCGGVAMRQKSQPEEDAAQAALMNCATAFSPKIESACPGAVILDLTGTEKLLGPPESAAKKLSAAAGERGLHVRIAVASNPDAAMHAARGFPGITVIPPGNEAQRLAGLRVDQLPATPEALDVLHGWGIYTFRSLAELPEIPLTERLGQSGLHLQRLARGEVQRTLVPAAPLREFIESYEFEDPVETLESVSFVLNRLLQQVCVHLVSHALATNELRLTLDLAVTQRRNGNDGEHYHHRWKLPVATQDARMLFRLSLLDLERNTFSAPIRRVAVEVLPVKPRAAQGNLFAASSPEAEKLEITLARLRGVVGDADADGIRCVGSPEIVDTHRPGAFAVHPFSSAAAVVESVTVAFPTIALRIFRPALETSVELDGKTPRSVRFAMKHRSVLAASGPWCTSGNWWSNSWDREEWDVALNTTAGIGFYRIYRDRISKRWFVEGIFD